MRITAISSFEFCRKTASATPTYFLATSKFLKVRRVTSLGRFSSFWLFGRQCVEITNERLGARYIHGKDPCNKKPDLHLDAWRASSAPSMWWQRVRRSIGRELASLRAKRARVPRSARKPRGEGSNEFCQKYARRRARHGVLLCWSSFGTNTRARARVLGITSLELKTIDSCAK